MNEKTFPVRGVETRCTTCEATIPAGELVTATTHVEVRPGRAHARNRGQILVIDRSECAACVAKCARALRIRNACI